MYPTELTDSQWEVIQLYLPVQRKRKYSLRAVVEAKLYVLKTGCQWRMLPVDFPPYQLIYYYFRSWTVSGLWQELNQQLNRLYRLGQGRFSSPSVAIVDSQTVKNSERGLNDTGFDGHKRIKGRKRHLAVDTLGLVLAVSLTAAKPPLAYLKNWQISSMNGLKKCWQTAPTEEIYKNGVARNWTGS